MGMKLYVGNLAYSVDNGGLEDLFAPFGSVRSAQVIMKPRRKRSTKPSVAYLLGLRTTTRSRFAIRLSREDCAAERAL